jgi:hypothetical protein
MTTKPTHIEQIFHEGTVHVCAHRVSFFYRIPCLLYNDTKQCLTEEAESRAKSQIIKGYVQGELNYETDDFQATGWWRIDN